MKNYNSADKVFIHNIYSYTLKKNATLRKQMRKIMTGMNIGLINPFIGNSEIRTIDNQILNNWRHMMIKIYQLKNKGA